MVYDNDGPIYSMLSGKRPCSDDSPGNDADGFPIPGGCPYCKLTPLNEWFADYVSPGGCPPGYESNASYDPNREDGKPWGCINIAAYTYVLLTEEENNTGYCYAGLPGHPNSVPSQGGSNIRFGCCDGVCPPTPCF